MRVELVIATFLSCGLLHAQSADWNRVQAVPEGTRLIVTTRRTLPCTLSRVTEERIDCELHGAILPIDKSRIRRVSLPRSGKAAAVGTAVGAIAGGVIVGATNSNQDGEKGVRVLAGAGLGGCVGFLIGHVVGRANGTTIYIAP